MPQATVRTPDAEARWQKFYQQMEQRASAKRVSQMKDKLLLEAMEQVAIIPAQPTTVTPKPKRKSILKNKSTGRKGACIPKLPQLEPYRPHLGKPMLSQPPRRPNTRLTKGLDDIHGNPSLEVEVEDITGGAAHRPPDVLENASEWGNVEDVESNIMDEERSGSGDMEDKKEEIEEDEATVKGMEDERLQDEIKQEMEVVLAERSKIKAGNLKPVDPYPQEIIHNTGMGLEVDIYMGGTTQKASTGCEEVHYLPIIGKRTYSEMLGKIWVAAKEPREIKKPRITYERCFKVAKFVWTPVQRFELEILSNRFESVLGLGGEKAAADGINTSGKHRTQQRVFQLPLLSLPDPPKKTREFISSRELEHIQGQQIDITTPEQDLHQSCCRTRHTTDPWSIPDKDIGDEETL